MINFQFFPRSQGATQRILQIIDCFKSVDAINKEHLKSNEMLALLRPYLEAIDLKLKQENLRMNKFWSLFYLATITK